MEANSESDAMSRHGKQVQLNQRVPQPRTWPRHTSSDNLPRSGASGNSHSCVLLTKPSSCTSNTYFAANHDTHPGDSRFRAGLFRCRT